VAYHRDFLGDRVRGAWFGDRSRTDTRSHAVSGTHGHAGRGFAPGDRRLRPFKLTPEQQQALELVIIKTSQNPVGNITVFPFQNNFNYGYGPYTRFQYNLNVQPVFPIMLSQQWTLVARTIFPIVNQTSSAPPTICALQFGCPSTFGLGDMQEQLFFGSKTKPGQLIWAVGPIFQFPTATPNTLGSGKWAVRNGRCRWAAGFRRHSRPAIN
jgi:hypothetical protein